MSVDGALMHTFSSCFQMHGEQSSSLLIPAKAEVHWREQAGRPLRDWAAPLQQELSSNIEPSIIITKTGMYMLSLLRSRTIRLEPM